MVRAWDATSLMLADSKPTGAKNSEKLCTVHLFWCLGRFLFSEFRSTQLFGTARHTTSQTILEFYYSEVPWTERMLFEAAALILRAERKKKNPTTWSLGPLRTLGLRGGGKRSVHFVPVTNKCWSDHILETVLWFIFICLEFQAPIYPEWISNSIILVFEKPSLRTPAEFALLCNSWGKIC